MADTSFDVIIIGSGPGGYVTAIRAAQLGFKAAGLTFEGLGIAPDSLEAVAPQYLWRFRAAGQFQRKNA